jgi:hypothetical protein
VRLNGFEGLEEGTAWRRSYRGVGVKAAQQGKITRRHHVHRQSYIAPTVAREKVRELINN